MSERAVPESTWVSSHAFYQDDLDHLVVQVVAPLVDELAATGLARRFFFLRYWDGGLHVRLRVLPAEDARRAEVEKLIADRFTGYFTRHPATARTSVEEYARSARRLAHWEGVSSYAEHPYPTNSVLFIPYRREHGRYGHGAAIQAVEQHFTESSEIALGILTRGASMDRRITAAAALILLTWFVAIPEPERLMLWTNGRAWDVPEPGAAVPRRDQVTGLARQMRSLAAGAGQVATAGTLVDWVRSIRVLRDALAADASQDRAAAANRAATILDVCAHLICNRLGLSPTVEGALRAAATEAVGALADEKSRP